MNEKGSVQTGPFTFGMCLTIANRGHMLSSPETGEGEG